MDDVITRQEHEEFAKRIDAEETRQNRRIGNLEKAIQENTALTISVEKLAVSMENMAKEQKSQGDRLEKLEAQDGEMWRKVTSHIITLIIGALVTFVLTQLGL